MRVGREQRHLAVSVAPVGAVRVSIDQLADGNAISSLFKGHFRESSPLPARRGIRRAADSPRTPRRSPSSSSAVLQQRIFTPAATITALQAATVSIAIDEDQTIRIDVLEGEVRVQHTLLPRNEPTIVRAVDAILVQRDQQITRRVDRGTLYRYAIKPLRDLWVAVVPGHASHSGDPIEGNKFLAANYNTQAPIQ